MPPQLVEALTTDLSFVLGLSDLNGFWLGLHGKPASGRGPMVGEPQWIRRKEVLRVSDKPATIWGDGLAAVKAAEARDRCRMSSNKQIWNSSPVTHGDLIRRVNFLAGEGTNIKFARLAGQISSRHKA